VCDYANRLIALGYDAFGQRVLQTGTSTTMIYPFKWYSVASSTGNPIGGRFRSAVALLDRKSKLAKSRTQFSILHFAICHLVRPTRRTTASGH
jgi:hypothetical protein